MRRPRARRSRLAWSDGGTHQTAGGILRSTHVGVWVLFILAMANGVFLYFLPSSAETDYAWSIVPPVNGAFIGAGFLAGTLATGLVLFAATRWRSLATRRRRSGCSRRRCSRPP